MFIWLDGRHRLPLTKTRPRNSSCRPRATMQTAYVQMLLLVSVFVGGTLSDLVKGTVSGDGLCTYTFRDVCVRQRVPELKKLGITVDNQQAQMSLLLNVVAGMRATMKQQQRTIDGMKHKIGETICLTVH